MYRYSVYNQIKIIKLPALKLKQSSLSENPFKNCIAVNKILKKLKKRFILLSNETHFNTQSNLCEQNTYQFINNYKI